MCYNLYLPFLVSASWCLQRLTREKALSPFSNPIHSFSISPKKSSVAGAVEELDIWSIDLYTDADIIILETWMWRAYYISIYINIYYIISLSTEDSVHLLVIHYSISNYLEWRIGKYWDTDYRGSLQLLTITSFQVLGVFFTM